MNQQEVQRLMDTAFPKIRLKVEGKLGEKFRVFTPDTMVGFCPVFKVFDGFDHVPEGTHTAMFLNAMMRDFIDGLILEKISPSKEWLFQAYREDDQEAIFVVACEPDQKSLIGEEWNNMLTDESIIPSGATDLLEGLTWQEAQMNDPEYFIDYIKFVYPDLDIQIERTFTES